MSNSLTYNLLSKLCNNQKQNKKYNSDTFHTAEMCHLSLTNGSTYPESLQLWWGEDAGGDRCTVFASGRQVASHPSCVFFFLIRNKWLLESPQMGEARANMKYSILITWKFILFKISCLLSIYLFTIYLFVYLFIHSFIYSFIIYSFIYSFIIYLFIDLFIYSFIYLFV